MAVTEAEIEALLAELARAQQAWIDGRSVVDDGAHLVEAPAMTILGPFGGLDLDVRQARASARFHGGTSSQLRMHRHADPPIDLRPLDQTLALLPG